MAVPMAVPFLVHFILCLATGFAKQEFTPVVSTVGGQTTLPCAFQHKEGFTPRYIVQWQREGVIVPVYVWAENYPPHISKQYEGRVSLAGRASLNLIQIAKSDQGMYECVVFLLPSQQSVKPLVTKVFLEVQDLPIVTIVTTPPNYLMKKVGESVQMECTVGIDDTSNVKYRWLRNGHDLEAFGDLCKRTVVTENGILNIDSILTSDAGNYTCLVLRKDYNDSWSSTTELIIQN